MLAERTVKGLSNRWAALAQGCGTLPTETQEQKDSRKVSYADLTNETGQKCSNAQGTEALFKSGELGGWQG